MLLRRWLIVAVCLSYGSSSYAKYCQEVRVSNFLIEFERQLRDCSVIVGNLKIVFMEKTKIADYQNLTFPELTEIRGYLLLYRVKGLTSLGKLFPNLAVIRGMTLITDYSMVLYDVPHLQEIGLSNLKYITRGSTRIERCRNLCYVHTIDWSKIGGTLHDLDTYNINEKDCQSCPVHCNGHCWNQEYCQVVKTDCDPECIGCNGPTSSNCHACKSYKDDTRCVSKCPPKKIPHLMIGTCVTEQECFTSLNRTCWVFQGQCVNSCPSSHYTVSPQEGYCKYCGSTCKKVCSGTQVDSIATAQELRGCTHINGSLSIRIDSKSTAGELEETLGLIEEVDGFLKIYRSHPLTSLEFFKRLKVIKGNELENKRHSFIVFENQNLQQLWSWDNFTMRIERGTISFHGNPQLCLSEIEKLVKIANLPQIYTTNDVSPYSNGDKTACNYINLEVSIAELTPTNVTLKWQEFHTSDGDSFVIGYVLYFIEDPLGNITIYDEHSECDVNGWDSIFVSSNTYQITNLKPYTKYAYYIETYTTYGSSSFGGQTHVAQFITPPDYPSVPLNLRSYSTTSNSVTLVWKPPKYLNGILNHYNIAAIIESDNLKYISERNYCTSPHLLYSKSFVEPPTTDLWTNSSLNSSCCQKEKEKITPESFDVLCTNLYRPGEFQQNFHNTSLNITIKTVKNASVTKYVIDSLRHFTTYTFYLQACNHKLCSVPAVISQRTLKSESADLIPSKPIIYVTDDDVFINWLQPKDPNSVILSYEVEYRRADLEHSKSVIECVTQKEFQLSGYEFQMRNLYPGQYSLRVKSVSLAGPGEFTEYVSFEILFEDGVSLAVILVPCILVVFVIVGFVTYFYYKRKQKLDNFHLIANINPDYAGTVYVEDEWEMDREDILVSKALGQGTFGMVYNGLIKSQNRPCAVKTVNEHSNVQERISFLNEASVMKAFHSGHHVIKLLGVVSKGDPPLVVMELMGRGDLKSFLRKSRDSSTSITCLEMYRMAAEIADGMMYLAAKKFVHRDLAARNCMVASDHTVKIGDFGMTRDIYETDYYRKETRGLMPVRWMSPESLADGVFTTDSDVWSYGVVLWEMATLSEQPYQGLANEQVLQFVIAQGTLERPPECPDLLYEIMSACWKWRPNQRPLFSNIVEKLELNVGQNFRLVSFYHSSEGEESRMNAKDRVYNAPALTVGLNKSTAIHWRTSNDDVSLYSQESEPPTSLLSSYQPQSKLSNSSYR